jgi:RimJ/RimL family protein N-acetyltransferase
MQGQSEFRLPLATPLMLSRPRWAGPLSAVECKAARANGVALAFDPAQGGWVLADACDGHDPEPPIWAGLSRVTSRAWHPDDLPGYHAMLNDPGLWQFLPEAMPDPLTLDVARDLLAVSVASPHHRVQAIVTAQGVAGQVRMLWQGPGLAPDSAEISYWLGRAHRGRGLAQAAVRQAATAALADRPGLRRVVGFVHPDNAASARVLTRAGFAATGHRADGWQVFALSRE